MIELLIIVVCLILNSVLSGIEMAFVTVSKPYLKKLAQSGSTAAQRVLTLKKNPERVLSVLQIGITLVGAISAAVGGAGAEEYLSPRLMEYFAISEETSEALSIVIIVLPLTYLSVVVGELVPKTLALKFPLKLSLMGGYILVILDKIFSPFVSVLEFSTKMVTKLISLFFKSENLQDTSREIDLDNLSESHKQYVFNLIDVDHRKVKDVMIPWNQVSLVEIGDHYHDIFEKIKTSRHTRLPVIQNEKVIGLIHAKEFLSEAEIAKIDWTSLIRECTRLGPREKILNALKKLQSRHSHMGIVFSDNEPVGIVTIEDIFEEVVGEIFDEDDQPKGLLSTNSKIRAPK